jgi:signal transduction histidine kinase
MKILRRLSVKWLLVIVMVAFTAIVLLVQGIPLASYLRTVERDRIVTGLERDAFTLAGASEEALQTGAQTEIDNVEGAATRYAATSGARVVVVDAQGAVTVSSDGTDLNEDYTNRPEIQTALSGSPTAGERDSQTAGEPLLYVAVPVRSGSDILGAVRITYPAAEVDAVVDGKVRLLAVVGLVTLLAAAGIAILLAGVVTGPLRRLRETSEAIADGDLAARVDTDTIGELRSVADAFNRMAERVESLVAAQRGFAGDASHQLRTPLTALRLRLETLEDVAQDDPDEVARSLDAMRDDVDRMQRLIDGLLVLARADRTEQNLISLDPMRVVRERVEAWEPLAAERDVSISLRETTDSIDHVAAAPEALEQIVDNYIDNAVEVAPQGSTIEVTVEASPGRVSIAVEDRGPGLSAEEKMRAFDRFWRGDQSRPGSGLGLAIVKALADASDATVHLEDAQHGGPGVRAIVELTPSAAAPLTPPAE